MADSKGPVSRNRNTQKQVHKQNSYQGTGTEQRRQMQELSGLGSSRDQSIIKANNGKLDGPNTQVIRHCGSVHDFEDLDFLGRSAADVFGRVVTQVIRSLVHEPDTRGVGVTRDPNEEKHLGTDEDNVFRQDSEFGDSCADPYSG